MIDFTGKLSQKSSSGASSSSSAPPSESSSSSSPIPPSSTSSADSPLPKIHTGETREAPSDMTSIQMMKLTLMDAFRPPRKEGQNQLVYRRSETFKSVSMYFVILVIWSRATASQNKLKPLSFLAMMVTSIQSLISARYHATSALTPLHVPSRRLCAVYHQDIIGICFCAIFVASVILSMSIPKIYNAAATASATFTAAKLHGRFAARPGRMASKKFPYTRLANRAMISSYFSVVYLVAVSIFACQHQLEKADENTRIAAGALAVSCGKLTMGYVLTGVVQTFGPKRGGISCTFSHMVLAFANSEMCLFCNNLSHFIDSSSNFTPIEDDTAADFFNQESEESEF